jgi:uncharacterized membrane protein
MKTLVAAAIAWPLLLGSVVWARQGDAHPLWTSAIYRIGSMICHQKADRSFHTGGVPWPVCARCTGLYAAAPFGAVIAIAAASRRRSTLWKAGAWPIFIVAAIPTAITLAIEWPRIAATSNLVRFVTALPLGAAVAFLIVRVAGSSRANQVN